MSMKLAKYLYFLLSINMYGIPFQIMFGTLIKA